MGRDGNGRHRRPRRSPVSRLWWLCASALAWVLSPVARVIDGPKDRRLRAALEAPPVRPALEAAPARPVPALPAVPRPRPAPLPDGYDDAGAESLVRPYMAVRVSPDLLMGEASAEDEYRFR
ncbi:hypothetical protein ACFVWN_23635 [Nocardiopsis flavescens]|uniref:hypothetical protein n=1 Tax=Nocardiopsis flavescens TaxID=758803 RepID=UPI003662B61B